MPQKVANGAQEKQNLASEQQVQACKQMQKEFRQLITPYMSTEFKEGKDLRSMTRDEAVKIAALESEIQRMAKKYDNISMDVSLDRTNDKNPEAGKVQEVLNEAVRKLEQNAGNPLGFRHWVQNQVGKEHGEKLSAGEKSAIGTYTDEVTRFNKLVEEGKISLAS